MGYKLWQIENRAHELPAWLKCLQGTVLGYKVPVGTYQILMAHILAKKIFPAQSRKTLDNMINDLKLSMRELIEGAEWMDFGTRFEALGKLDAMEKLVGYPMELMEDDEVAGIYQGLQMSEV